MPSRDLIDAYVDRLQHLRVNRQGDRASPHKPCMLLAVLDLAEAGALTKNRIDYSPALLERYALYFERVREPSDHANPYFPFFHLRSEGFWHLIAKPGREAALGAMRTARSHGDIDTNIDHVELDPELHQILVDRIAIEALRQSLVSRWFGTKADALAPLLEEAERENRYEYTLREGDTGLPVAEEIPEAVRSSAFRRLVLEIYDYRCAATGWRILVPGGGAALLDAAHIIPFSESHNDDPGNGIALTPTFHRAFDQFLIAPGPDLKWHVAPIFDDRLPEHQPLLSLEGRDVLLPSSAYRPANHGLEWRMEHLRTE